MAAELMRAGSPVHIASPAVFTLCRVQCSQCTAPAARNSDPILRGLRTLIDVLRPRDFYIKSQFRFVGFTKPLSTDHCKVAGGGLVLSIFFFLCYCA